MFYCVKHTSHILGHNVFCYDSGIFLGPQLECLLAHFMYSRVHHSSVLRKSLDPCERCGAEWYAAVLSQSERLETGGSHAAGEPTDSQLEAAVMLAGGSDVGVESDAKRVRTTSPRGAGGSARQADAMYAKLQSMMEWRQMGLMDSPELKAAKRELLGLQ